MTQEMPVRPIQPDDMFKLKIIQDARLSPDGAQVAYAVTHTEGEKDRETDHTAIWLMNLASGETRQLTTGTASDSSPRWSPDGTQIAFLSTRAGKNQVHVIAVDGGEARALTTLPQGAASAPEWSPDGTRIAFGAPPQAEPRSAGTPYRLDRHIYRFDALGYLDDVAQSIYVMPVAGGEATRLTNDRCHNARIQWSPDGQSILYAATMLPDTHSYDANLRVVDLSGNVRSVVEGWGSVTTEAWLPDGSGIVFAGVPEEATSGTQGKLWLVGNQGGEPQPRSAGFDFNVAGGMQADVPGTLMRSTPRLFVSPDGQKAYVQAQIGGTIQVYAFALSGAPSWQAVCSGDRSCLPLDLRAGRLLLVESTLANPGDLVVANLNGGDERRLTHLNADLFAGFAMPSVERLLFPGPDGVQVEGWLMKPATGAAPYPTILYIHGGPHSAFGHIFQFDYLMLAAAGYAVLFINQRASTGYGDSFSTAIKGDWGNLDYKDLMSGLDYAIARGLVDSERLGCCGLSGGGNLSCWIVGQTDRFKAAVPENPVTNWVSFYGVSDIGPVFSVDELGGKPHEIPEVYARCSPITYAHRCKTPTLLVQGESDWRCPAEQSEQFYTVLRANGCIVEMVRLPGSSHGGSKVGAPAIRRAQNEALLGWMNRYVRQTP